MNGTTAQINMIKQQLRTGNIVDEKIIQLYQDILREDFVPAAHQLFAYSDMHIPLLHGQYMLTPLEEASILQALALQGTETVLEVGTGSGFLTAMLSRLCHKVHSLDYFADFTQQAQKLLHQYGCHNVELHTLDGSRGWYDHAPFDIIVLTGGLPALYDVHRLQVIPGGKLFAIIGEDPVMQGQLHQQQSNGEWHVQNLFSTDIPMLIEPMQHKKFVF